MGLYVEPVDRIQNSAVVLMTRLLQPVLTIISVLLMRLMMSHPVSSPSSDVVVMTSLQLQVSILVCQKRKLEHLICVS